MRNVPLHREDSVNVGMSRVGQSTAKVNGHKRALCKQFDGQSAQFPLCTSARRSKPWAFCKISPGWAGQQSPAINGDTIGGWSMETWHVSHRERSSQNLKTKLNCTRNTRGHQESIQFQGCQGPFELLVQK
jgi:hypothetical protein